MKMLNLYVLVVFMCLMGCSDSTAELNANFGEASVRDRIVDHQSPLAREFLEQVNPIIENRCVVCHGCYDAPCQLKLSSPAGIDRGFSPESVYATRLKATEPTRLNIDAKTTQEWRDKHYPFKPVLNERSQTPKANLEGSVFYQLLAQKQEQAVPEQTVLPDSFDFSLTRTQTCSSIENYSNYKKDFPLGGMPYGLPAVSTQEYKVLVKWLKQGSPMAKPRPLTERLQQNVLDWEKRFNGTDNKSKLVARYIYEHLFLGHLYFSEQQLEPDELPVYFKLVRSTTPSGETIDEIASRRPYDDPNLDTFYYRLRRVEETILSKTHLPYALNTTRAKRWDDLFYQKNFSVSVLPDYKEFNPFKVFSTIPVDVRYRFLLDNAQYFINGFIKGPVCRGQVALGVIQDKFWVFFKDPNNLQSEEYNNFVYQQADNLELPSNFSEQHLALKSWLTFSKKEKAYIDAQKAAIDNKEIAHKYLGEHTIYHGTPDASLTVFRNFDSGTVVKGLQGETPKTAWVINYPVFERIHYLLVAGFDIYGHVKHQLITRLYMDFLRIESEMSFITLLPKDKRKIEIQSWYQGSTKELSSYISDSNFFYNQDNTLEYHSDNVKHEVLTRLKKRYYNNLPKQENASKSLLVDQKLIITPDQKSLSAINRLPNVAIQQMGQINFILVEDEQGNHQGFTLLRHNNYKNVSSLLFSEKNHLPDLDTAEIYNGFIGSYPQVIFKLKQSELNRFIETFSLVEDKLSYKKLVDIYGLRRTHPEFWRYSDVIHRVHKANNKIIYGLFDYNRLENR